MSFAISVPLYSHTCQVGLHLFVVSQSVLSSSFDRNGAVSNTGDLCLIRSRQLSHRYVMCTKPLELKWYSCATN